MFLLVGKFSIYIPYIFFDIYQECKKKYPMKNYPLQTYLIIIYQEIIQNNRRNNTHTTYFYYFKNVYK